MPAGVRIPQVVDIREAIELYWRKTEIGTGDICKLFGISRERAGKLKAVARAVMNERGTISYNAMCVNTDVAFEAWGLRIADLEKRYAKLQKLEETKGETTSCAS